MKIFLLFLLSCATVLGTIIPDTNCIPWCAGVSNGIPTISVGVNVVTDYGAVGDGVTDDYSAITNAIENCPADTAVYFPAGTYRVNSQVSITRSGIVLRGAGATNTTIVSYATSGSAAFYVYGTSGTSNSLSSGYTKGSTNLECANGALFSVGQFVTVKQSNDTSVIIGNLPSSSTHYQCQIVKLLSISGSDLTIDRPLYYTYDAAQAPYIKSFTARTNIGFENMTISMSGTVSDIIRLYYCANSWIRGIESTNAKTKHIALWDCYKCEVRSNLFHRMQGYDSTYMVDLTENTTDCLIEDNIFDEGNNAVVIQNGASGNVVGYNYMARGYSSQYPNTTLLTDALFSHGGNANQNLWEGNVMHKVTIDDYWGCNRLNTYFRNWITRNTTNESGNPVTGSLYSVVIYATNYYNNFVGNILCLPKDAGDADASHAVWLLGRASGHVAPTYPVDDLNVTNTTLLHGNFDWVSQTTTWDATITDHALPSSYYLSIRPSWFGALAWPAIGPDIAVCITSGITNNALIPAQARYIGYTYEIKLRRLLWRH